MALAIPNRIPKAPCFQSPFLPKERKPIENWQTTITIASTLIIRRPGIGLILKQYGGDIEYVA